MIRAVYVNVLIAFVYKRLTDKTVCTVYTVFFKRLNVLHLPQQKKYRSSSSTVMLVGLIGELKLVRSVDVRVRGCLSLCVSLVIDLSPLYQACYLT